MVTLICRGCLNRFDVDASKAEKRRFCSNDCRYDPLLRVEKNGVEGCWIWTGWRDQKGYGRIRNSECATRAHRYFYERFVGSIPEGLQLDHLCHNTSCVNPRHLEPVTNGENQVRSLRVINARAAATCKNGHSWTVPNTYIHPTIGSRVCRTCTREAAKRYYDRRYA